MITGWHFHATINRVRSSTSVFLFSEEKALYNTRPGQEKKKRRCILYTCTYVYLTIIKNMPIYTCRYTTTYNRYKENDLSKRIRHLTALGICILADIIKTFSSRRQGIILRNWFTEDRCSRKLF